MNDPRRQRFQPYLRDLADRLGLRDWHVTIDDSPPDDAGDAACVGRIYGQRRARVWLGEGFLADGPEEQRATLIHELLHLHFADMDTIVRKAEIGAAYARAVAPGFPLPPDADAE